MSLNGNQVLNNFDPIMAAGGAFKAIDKEFQASVSDERLVIRFDPVRGAPIVNAIEIVPSTAIRVRAGGASYNDANGQAWSGDYNYSAGAVLSTGAPIAGTSDAGLYQTQRTAPGGFDYQFAVPDGNYTVVLHFAEILDSFGPGSRVFNVSINGAPVLMNFDPAASAGGSFKAVERAFPVTVNTHELTIHFDAVIDAPIVNAIEVLSLH